MADKKTIIEFGLHEWSAYFRRKLTQTVIDMYIGAFLPYQKSTIREVFKERIDHGEKFPYIHEVKSLLSNKESLLVQYDPEGDQRYPLDLMWKAFNYLKEHGEQGFSAYCDSLNMPKDERSAVLCKWNVAYGTNEVVEGILKDADPNRKKMSRREKRIREKVRQNRLNWDNRKEE